MKNVELKKQQAMKNNNKIIYLSNDNSTLIIPDLISFT